MAVTKMGFEGEIYYGAAGTTASTKLTNVRETAYAIETEEGDTTVRGSGSSPPITTVRVVGLGVSITWQMLNKTNDTSLSAMRTAAAAGNPVAIRVKDYSSGTGYDGDVILKIKNGQPFKGEQTFDFEAIPNDDNRTPTLNS